jgi:large subunit ribosomal protein L23
MAFFSHKKDEDKKLASKKDANVLEMVKEPVTEKAEKTPVVLKENTGSAHRILRNHHLSEKSNMLSQTGRYIFRVAQSANKIEVKKAVESVYDVHVRKVNIINTLGKKRRQGRSTGYTQDWKKAIITLKEGERIAGLAEGV